MAAKKERNMPQKFRQFIVAFLIAALLVPQGSLLAAEPAAGSPDPQAPGAAPTPAAPQLSAAQLEQLAAPVALYPDALLAQVLMAATYPLEVVSAARWIKANAKLQGAALDKAAEQQPWDPSVKSLLKFPQVLQMMDEKLDWTQQLGNAFLAQPQDVMNAVQHLRSQARAHGSLKSNQQQTVTVDNSGPSKVIVIQPAQPSVVYVPTYNPTVVYGPWPYPAYPPYAWYPPGYVATGMLLSFGVGVAAGYALWGYPDWHHGSVNINYNYYGRPYGPPPPPPGYRPGGPPPGTRPGPGPGSGPYQGPPPGGSSWHHDPVHRGNVPYANSSVARQYQAPGRGGMGTAQERMNAREAFRGRTGVTPGAYRPSPGMGGASRPSSPAGRPGRQQYGRPDMPDQSGQRPAGPGGMQRPGSDDSRQSARRNAQQYLGQQHAAPHPGGSGGGGQHFSGGRPDTGARQNFARPSEGGSGFFHGVGGQSSRGEMQRGFQSREIMRDNPGGGGFHGGIPGFHGGRR